MTREIEPPKTFETVPRPRPDTWTQLFQDEKKLAELMGAFKEVTGIDFCNTPIKALGNRVIVPESLITRPEDIRGGPLTALGIVRHMLLGHIVISPFDPELLGANGYDFRVSCLQGYARREIIEGLKDRIGKTGQVVIYHEGSQPRSEFIINPYNPDDVDHIWHLVNGTQVQDIKRQSQDDWATIMGENRMDASDCPIDLRGAHPLNRAFLIPGHQTILLRTEEVIGGIGCVVPKMLGKSSSRRWDFTVCGDAQLGNLNWIGHWAIEVQNITEYTKFLVHQTPLGQMEFTLTAEDLPSNSSYAGQYASIQAAGNNLQTLYSNVERYRQRYQISDLLPRPLRSPGPIVEGLTREQAFRAWDKAAEMFGTPPRQN
ncbi:MAG: hypothetical protein ABIB61_02040 [Candidatus Shapirobacteria bacterium]